MTDELNAGIAVERHLITVPVCDEERVSDACVFVATDDSDKKYYLPQYSVTPDDYQPHVAAVDNGNVGTLSLLLRKRVHDALKDQGAFLDELPHQLNVFLSYQEPDYPHTPHKAQFAKSELAGLVECSLSVKTQAQLNLLQNIIAAPDVYRTQILIERIPEVAEQVLDPISRGATVWPFGMAFDLLAGRTVAKGGHLVIAKRINSAGYAIGYEVEPVTPSVPDLARPLLARVYSPFLRSAVATVTSNRFVDLRFGTAVAAFTGYSQPGFGLEDLTLKDVQGPNFPYRAFEPALVDRRNPILGARISRQIYAKMTLRPPLEKSYDFPPILVWHTYPDPTKALYRVVTPSLYQTIFQH